MKFTQKGISCWICPNFPSPFPYCAIYVYEPFFLAISGISMHVVHAKRHIILDMSQFSFKLLHIASFAWMSRFFGHIWDIQRNTFTEPLLSTLHMKTQPFYLGIILFLTRRPHWFFLYWSDPINGYNIGHSMVSTKKREIGIGALQKTHPQFIWWIE